MKAELQGETNRWLNPAPGILNVGFHYQCMTLTNRVSGKDGLRGRTSQSRSCGIDSCDPEQVLGAFDQSGHHKGLAQAHGTDGVTGNTRPAFARCFFSFQPVASNWGAAIVFRLFPVNGH